MTRRAALPLLVAEATAASQGPPQSIVFLSALTFDSCLSGRTRRLAEALAAAGHDVTFVDMPSLRQVARPTSWLRRSYTSPAGVRVVRLPPLPWRARSGWPSVTSIWSSLAVRSLGRRVPGLEQAVVVASTPWWLPVARELPAWVRCYDYLDHVDVQAGPRRIEWFRRWDAELLRIADVVTTVSEPLRRHLQAAVPPERLHLVPNGVCGNWIDSPVVAAERGSLASRADAPIAGFLGALFEWVDLDLIAAVAGLLPQIEFVIVGPTRRGVRIDALLQLPNVRCHGPVPFEQVPATLAAFDVCLIPFRRDLISDYADPLKVYEYCALGKPVVSTVLFNAGGTEPPIAVAPSAEAFAAAIREALETSPADRDRWIAFARQHTWEARARQFAEIMSRTASTR